MTNPTPPAPPPEQPGSAGDPDQTATLEHGVATDTQEQPRADPRYVGGAAVPSQRAPEQLPPIDPEELAGLYDVEERAGAVRRVSPLQDDPSRIIARYLFPTERFRGEWRRHLIHLLAPIVAAVVSSIGLGLLAGFVEAASPPGVVAIVSLLVLAWLAVLGWVAWRVADWHFDRFILTNKRVMKVSGIISRDVAMMPLLRVTDMKYEQTPLGRILNYGTFVIESAGQDQALREVPHLPNPNELYLRVVEEMYEPEAVEARMTPDGEEEEDDKKRGDA
ncbi:PH domain-containing protein [Natronosporangium hydrolyticum]|uniref:PH domain-containing protein n=1 Tax=Natronosporangium hydrolyticum TaxID=2811111 RepID=A0A895YBW2_9ACTN|nr:PH domain-containing protein [Natronosporangium hydrolyticum]QSB14931.1 PH domain-containing protein [Natronosporangium hydrolyticum]